MLSFIYVLLRWKNFLVVQVFRFFGIVLFEGMLLSSVFLVEYGWNMILFFAATAKTEKEKIECDDFRFMFSVYFCLKFYVQENIIQTQS